jgi:hypothetical protein
MVMLHGVDRVNVPAVAHDLVRGTGGGVRRTFQHAVTAFSANLTEAQALAISASPLVSFVEEVAIVHPSSNQPLPYDNSLWHLDRIDQNSNVSDYQYNFCERGGGEYVYMIEAASIVITLSFEIRMARREWCEELDSLMTTVALLMRPPTTATGRAV